MIGKPARQLRLVGGRGSAGYSESRGLCLVLTFLPTLFTFPVTFFFHLVLALLHRFHFFTFILHFFKRVVRGHLHLIVNRPRSPLPSLSVSFSFHESVAPHQMHQ